MSDVDVAAPGIGARSTGMPAPMPELPAVVVAIGVAQGSVGMNGSKVGVACGYGIPGKLQARMQVAIPCWL